MIVVNNWHVPFEDFFSNLPGGIPIADFGLSAREEALKFVKSKDTVIDIGAHVGISVNHWAKEFINVIAFEPMIDHYQCLQKNIKNFNNIITHNCALGNFSGSTKGTYRSRKNSGSFQMIDSGYIQPRNESKIRNFVDIDVTTLDSYNFNNVDLIKIDVEGWEAEVLEGAQNTIKKNKPVLMIEILTDNPHKTLKTNYDYSRIFEILQKLNYKEVAHITPDDRIFIINE